MKVQIRELEIKNFRQIEDRKFRFTEGTNEIVGHNGSGKSNTLHAISWVLFGTDYPMWNPAQELERFLALHLPQRDEENILYNNAARLFGLDAEENGKC